ncbi:hypothetical protein Scep_010869 [Stephania cephalantha]|uniref:Uncharacterized protein n=1 Tax=Stephania cephalantha TaxID=152367 RepID=A0AAP0PDP8_9MAGN
MEKYCVAGKLDDSSYSTPVPLIGLYITGATLLCLLFILLDVFAGFRNKKRWLPCKFFSLNSVTLTLLSIAVKLPLDLTSPMPRVQDQLSKLTGTTLICICMGFCMPSLGTYRESECFSNMVALSIFVVTIVVNICIQMHTGVIILFRAEHTIILCCMTILLMALWYSALEIHKHNEFSHDCIKENFVKGQKSMLHRLKLSYLWSYNSNPQFMLCRRPLSKFITVICMICSVLILKVTFQILVSKNLEFCEESPSVYKWSMRTIVISQTITIISGILAITFRQLSLIGCVLTDEFGKLQDGVKDVKTIIACNQIFEFSCLLYVVCFSRFVIEMLVISISFLVACPFAYLDGFFGWLIKECKSYFGSCRSSRKNRNEEAVEEFKDLIHEGEMGLDKWTLWKGVNDMKIWTEKTKALNQHIKLLSKTHLSYQDDSPFLQLKAHFDLARPRYQVSSLTILLLVRIATVCIPSPLSESLSRSLDEVFEILHFVDRKMSSSSLENKKKHVLAEALWAHDNFNILLYEIVQKFGNNDDAFRNQSPLEQAIGIMKELKEVMRPDYIRDELAMTTDFIQGRAYESIDELYGYMEQLYVEMVKEFLVQLPNAIFKQIIESNAEDY